MLMTQLDGITNFVETNLTSGMVEETVRKKMNSSELWEFVALMIINGTC